MMEQIVNINIEKNHDLPFKILKRFVDALLIMLLLSVMFLAITPAPGHAQGREEVVLYEENFNDNQAQDWELDQGWTVTEGMSRYFIGFREGGLYLSKQDRLGNFFEGLAESSVSRGLNKWYNIEIIGEGPLIQVFVDEKLELDYTDPEPS